MIEKWEPFFLNVKKNHNNNNTDWHGWWMMQNMCPITNHTHITCEWWEQTQKKKHIQDWNSYIFSYQQSTFDTNTYILMLCVLCRFVSRFSLFEINFVIISERREREKKKQQRLSMCCWTPNGQGQWIIILLLFIDEKGKKNAFRYCVAIAIMTNGQWPKVYIICVVIYIFHRKIFQSASHEYFKWNEREKKWTNKIYKYLSDETDNGNEQQTK